MLSDDDLMNDNVTLVLRGYLKTCINVNDLVNAEALARAIAYHLDWDYDEITGASLKGRVIDPKEFMET